MSQFPTRRRVVSGVVRVSLAIPVLAFAGSVVAAGATPKSEVKYRFSPNGAAHCGDCVSFVPGETSGGSGNCKIVEGPIPQNGWCVLLAKRP